jgi:hypothetical protein
MMNKYIELAQNIENKLEMDHREKCPCRWDTPFVPGGDALILTQKECRHSIDSAQLPFVRSNPWMTSNSP